MGPSALTPLILLFRSMTADEALNIGSSIAVKSFSTRFHLDAHDF